MGQLRWWVRFGEQGWVNSRERQGLGDCTGRPDGFAPRSIRSTYPAPARNRSFEISDANPLWGAPRIHGELLKLGVDVGQTTVAKYMAKKATIVARLEDAPSQSCRR